jgi:serine phosphatase RsbU (regulator of sigma subunit)/anti-sigma regulatory factor (Ser/Thr protein kinase)
MRTENVLAAVGYGLWQWDWTSGTVALDGRMTSLLGLPGGPSTVTSDKVMECLHATDYAALAAEISMARADGTVAEAPVRVVDGVGTVLRTLRIRACPRSTIVSGTAYEVDPEQHGVRGGRDAGLLRAREAFLLDAGRALAEASSTAEVLKVASALSMPGFTPDGQGVFARDGDRLSIIGHYGQTTVDASLLDMPLEADYPAAVVVRSGRAVYLPTPASYKERFPTAWPLVSGYQRSSWAFVPLVVAGTTIGAWLAAFREPVEFTPDERFVLTTVARMLAQALSRAYVHESERALSDGLQRTMLPARRPEIDGMAVAARYVPTGGGLQVGGDWYDVIDLPSGRTALVIGDVQGHDVRAAGIMGQLRIALRAYAAEGHSPDAVLSRTSRFLSGLGDESHPGTDTGAADTDTDTADDDVRFATCLYLEVDPADGTVEVVRAGHPDPAIRLDDGTTIQRHTAGGLPLGVEPDSDYPTTRLVLEPGEVLMMCTDGLLETGGHDLDSGWCRVRDILASGPARDLEELADSLVRAVHGPTSHHTTGPLTDRREDDIALLLLRRDPDGPTCAVPTRQTVLTVQQSDPGQIRSAREDIRALLHDWTSADQFESAVLLVSELITNVLVHTDGDAVLVAQVTGMRGTRRVHVQVADRSDDMPHRRSPGELASSGRGLFLIEELADSWGVDPRGDGKSIWFDLYEARR